MTITHHPSDLALAGFAAGTLDEGQRLVVASHLFGCPACRSSAQALESVGGSLLDSASPVPLHADALARTMTRLTSIPPHPDAASARPLPSDVPAPLSLYELGPWRWIGRGVHWRTVNVPAGTGSRVFMLKAAPGTRLPDHRHEDTEWTCILKGAFRHDFGRYGPGDFDEADGSVEHRPFVEEGEPCVCLVALRGRILFQGWIGRLLQPLVRL